jgi:hypothetical protein
MRGLAIVALTGLVVAGGVLVIATDPLSIITYVSYTGVGALLVIRRPRNLASWLVLGLGIWPPITTTEYVDPSVVAAGTADTGTNLLLWLGSWAGAVTYTLYLSLTIVFPSGRLPGGRTRTVAIAALSGATLITILMAFEPTISYGSSTLANPYALLPDLPLWRILPDAGYLYLPLLAVVCVGFLSLVVRFRRATGVLRLQMRWLVTALAFLTAALVFGLLGSAVVGQPYSLVWLPVLLAYPTVPIAIGFAILRYRLYEIDRIISRTLAYAVLTALLVGVYVAGFLLIQLVLATFTSGGGPIAVAASTLVVFALFQPLRRRIQAAMDRRFNRSRYDAQRTVEAFAVRLRDEVDLARVQIALVDSVEDAVRPVSATVWLRVGSGGR